MSCPTSGWYLQLFNNNLQNNGIWSTWRSDSLKGWYKWFYYISPTFFFMSSPRSRWYLLLFTQSLEKSRDLMHPVGVEIIWLDEHLPANFCYLAKRNLFRGNNSLFVSLSNSLLLYIFSCCSIYPDLCFAGNSETSLLWGTKTWQLYPASSAGLFTPLAVTLSFSH